MYQPWKLYKRLITTFHQNMFLLSVTNRLKLDIWGNFINQNNYSVEFLTQIVMHWKWKMWSKEDELNAEFFNCQFGKSWTFLWITSFSSLYFCIQWAVRRALAVMVLVKSRKNTARKFLPQGCQARHTLTLSLLEQIDLKEHTLDKCP